MFVVIAVLVVVLIVLAASSVKVVREGHRFIVLRLGRPTSVRGPGMVWIFPVVDHVVDVNLDEVLPGWRDLDRWEVGERLFTWYRETPVV